MNENIIAQIKSDFLSYDEKIILKDIDFKINKGEIVGLVGESGSGKSTISYVLAGLKKPNNGFVNSNPKEIGFVMQNPQTSLDPLKTVFYTLKETYISHLKSSNKKILDNRSIKLFLESWLEKLGISKDRLFDYPHQFSGGELQRISIIRALIKESSFIILDEPTSMLDVLVQAKIIYLLLELKKEFNLTFLFISHDIDLVKIFCNYYYEIYNKRLIKKDIKGVLI